MDYHLRVSDFFHLRSFRGVFLYGFEIISSFLFHCVSLIAFQSLPNLMEVLRVWCVIGAFGGVFWTAIDSPFV